VTEVIRSSYQHDFGIETRPDHPCTCPERSRRLSEILRVLDLGEVEEVELTPLKIDTRRVISIQSVETQSLQLTAGPGVAAGVLEPDIVSVPSSR
jgi:hypothetical protein